jgi:DNA-binding NarL/FixJ family response regulator
LVQEIKPKEEPPAPPKEIKEPPVIKEEPPAAKPIRSMKKNEMVLYMKKEGMDDDKIAKELGISRGEVALILGIKK